MIFILIKRVRETETEKMKIFKTYKDVDPEQWNQRCLPFEGFNFLCHLMKTYITHWNTLQDEQKELSQRFKSYIFLRKQCLILYDNQIMAAFFKELLKRKKNLDPSQIQDFVFEKIQMKLYNEVEREMF